MAYIAECEYEELRIAQNISREEQSPPGRVSFSLDAAPPIVLIRWRLIDHRRNRVGIAIGIVKQRGSARGDFRRFETTDADVDRKGDASRDLGKVRPSLPPPSLPGVGGESLLG